MRARTIAILGAVLAICGVAALLLALRPVQEALPAAPTAADATRIIEACGQGPQEEKSACIATAALSAYDAVGDLPSILTEIDRQLQTNKSFQGLNCHGTMHEIGQKAYAKIGDAALTSGAPLCSGGYYHGVLIAGGNVQQARAMCDTVSTDDEKADCMHGAGHAIYLIEPDLTKAIEYCKGDKYEPCVAGYFMELAADNQREPKALKYCAEKGLDDTTRLACYNGILGDIAINHPKEAAAWCKDNAQDPAMLPGDCQGQLGSGIATGSNERNPSSDEALTEEILSLCQGNPTCLAGAAGVLSRHLNRSEAAEQVCIVVRESKEDLQGWYADACNA